MIDKLVAGYRKIQMGLISGLSGNTAAVLDETSFYDVGYMQTQIERIKKELKYVTDDLSRKYFATSKPLPCKGQRAKMRVLSARLFTENISKPLHSTNAPAICGQNWTVFFPYVLASTRF